MNDIDKLYETLKAFEARIGDISERLLGARQNIDKIDQGIKRIDEVLQYQGEQLAGLRKRQSLAEGKIDNDYGMFERHANNTDIHMLPLESPPAKPADEPVKQGNFTCLSNELLGVGSPKTGAFYLDKGIHSQKAADNLRNLLNDGEKYKALLEKARDFLGKLSFADFTRKDFGIESDDLYNEFYNAIEGEDR